ncbi:hypothetical protein N9K47_00450, partial [bacterium]|nr:hypothetical protein [bacterium]
MNLAPTEHIRVEILTERVSIEPGRLMLALAQYEPELKDLLTSGLSKYIAHAAKNDNQVMVRYSDLGVGRLVITAVEKDRAGNYINKQMVTQPHMWNWCKAVMCCDHYTDMDIVQCHPTLLVQMFEHCDLQVPVLKRYIKNHSQVMKETGLPKHVFKKYLLSVLYYPHADDAAVKNKLKEYGLSKEPGLLTKLRVEIKTASARVLEMFSDYTDAAVYKHGSDYFNIPGVALSLLAQTAEKKCILALYDFWTSRGVHVGALVHDGLHVDKEAATPPMLSLAAEFIRKRTGYTVKLAYKDWQPHPVYEQSVIANDAMDCLAHAHKLLEGRVLRCDDRVWYRDSTYQWHADSETVLRLISNEISGMHIFGTAGDRFVSISRNVQSQCGIGSMLTIAKQVYATAPEEPGFVDRLRRENIGRLVFQNGYYDFSKRQFVPEMVDCLARVPFDFPERNDTAMAECRRKIVEPILGSLEKSMMTWFSRGIAGHVTDKDWAAFLGERNSGKSVLIGLLEQAFGSQLVATLNAETFMCSKFADTDTAKALGFLLQVEHHRLIFTNECDVSGDKLINGALVKKLSSGGDSISARALYQNACTFKLSGRLCMAANDMPDVAPSDTIQTLSYFQAPRVFVQPGDERLKTDPMYMAADDSIKDYCCTPEARGAITHLLLDAYGPPVRTKQMDMMREEYSAGSDDREKFFENFEVSKDQTSDYIPVKEVAERVKKQKLAVTARRYNRWLKASGCDVGARRTTEKGNRMRVVAGLKRKYNSWD